jgi:hypothetical protein
MSTYYTDREYGARAPSIDTIDERLWAELYTLIQTRIGDGSFGLRFPEQCPDGVNRRARLTLHLRDRSII